MVYTIFILYKNAYLSPNFYFNDEFNLKPDIIILNELHNM